MLPTLYHKDQLPTFSVVHKLFFLRRNILVKSWPVELLQADFYVSFSEPTVREACDCTKHNDQVWSFQ